MSVKVFVRVVIIGDKLTFMPDLNYNLIIALVIKFC